MWGRIIGDAQEGETMGEGVETPSRGGRAGLAAGWLGAGLAAVLAACQPRDHLSDGFLHLYVGREPTIDEFYQCHGYGCTLATRIGLTAAEWQLVREEFTPPPGDAREERRRIAAALALMERLVGRRTGTSAHQWSRSKQRINPNPSHDPTQLDCIDETINTWTYLTLFARDRLLRHHRVRNPAYAGGLPEFTWDQRNTAVIQAIASGTDFAVDPTLADAGEEPPIFPLALWLGPWPPALPGRDEID